MPLFILFISGVAFGQAFRFFPFASLFLLIVVAALVTAGSTEKGTPLRKAARFCLVIAFGLTGFLLSRQSSLPASWPELGGSTLHLRGVVSTGAAPVGRDKGLFSQSVKVADARSADGRELPVREVRLLSDTALSEGQSYRLVVRMPRDSHFLNPGSMWRMPSLHVLEAVETEPPPAGLLGSLGNTFSRARAELNNELRRRFSERAAPFLMSQITGERGFMPKEVKDAFNVTGLAHLLSISGTHFGLLFVVLFRISRFLLKRLPDRALLRMTLYATPSQLGALLCLPLMVCYLGISDASVPAVRSFIMISFFLFGLVLQRRGLWLNTVLIAAVIIVAPDPAAVLDLSFQLSFVAVLCIGVALEMLRTGKPQEDGLGAEEMNGPGRGASGAVAREEATLRERMLRAAREGLTYSIVISLAATAGTAPLVAYHFHYFSLISPLTNLIITPFIGFVLLPVALLSAFVFLLSGYFPLAPLIESLADLAVTSVLLLGRLSFADVRIPGFPPALLSSFYCGLLAYIAVTMRVPAGASASSGRPFPGVLSRMAVALAVIPFVAYAAAVSLRPPALTVTYLDVGQGDAAVAELPDGKTVVIDTGRQGVQVGEYLKYRGKRAIDALVLSHGQTDHVGGVRYLTANFNVSEIWDNGNLVFDDSLTGPWQRRSLVRGDVIEAAGCRMTVLHPHRGFYSAQSRGGRVNNDSLVLKVSGKEKAFLFTGDIEREAQNDLLHLGAALRSNALKVPHHGSRTALHEAFLQTLSPEVAVISAGRSNAFGFPHREVLDALSGSEVYRTDLHGAVLIGEGADGSLFVKTWRDLQLTEASGFTQELRNLARLVQVWP